MNETLEAKQRYERDMFEPVELVQHYHADNGIFKAQEFTKVLESQYQKLTFIVEPVLSIKTVLPSAVLVQFSALREQ